jgi:hypothetical protein
MNSQINLGIGPYPNSRLVILFLIFITKRGTFMNKHSLLSVFSLIAASATHIAFADIQILVNGRAVDWSANADTANSNIANEKGEVTDKNALAKKIDASELHALQWSQYAPKSGDLEGLAALPDNEKADFLRWLYEAIAANDAMRLRSKLLQDIYRAQEKKNKREVAQLQTRLQKAQSEESEHLQKLHAIENSLSWQNKWRSGVYHFWGSEGLLEHTDFWSNAGRDLYSYLYGLIQDTDIKKPLAWPKYLPQSLPRATAEIAG